MLCRKEHRINLLCLHLLSKLHILPIYSNLRSSTIEPTSSRSKLVTWIVIALVVQFHVFYAAGRFLTSLRAEGFSVISTATVDYAVIMFGELGLHAMLESFVWNPAVTKLLCKNLAIEESNSIKDSRRRVFWGYSLTTVCTMLLPIGVFPAVPVVTLMYGSMHLWIETSGCSTGLCLVFFLTELTVNFLWMSFCYCIGLLQIVFLQKISHDMEMITENLR